MYGAELVHIKSRTNRQARKGCMGRLHLGRAGRVVLLSGCLCGRRVAGAAGYGAVWGTYFVVRGSVAWLVVSQVRVGCEDSCGQSAGCALQQCVCGNCTCVSSLYCSPRMEWQPGGRRIRCVVVSQRRQQQCLPCFMSYAAFIHRSCARG